MRLLLSGQQAIEQPRLSMAALGSLIAHAVLITLVIVVPLGPPDSRDGPRVRPDFSKATPLVAPPFELTQKEANKGTVSAEVTLQSLLNKPTLPVPPPPDPGMTRPSAPKAVETPPVAAEPAPKPLIEPPKFEEGKRETGDVVARNLPPSLGNNQVQIPAPQIEVREKPKLAFEKPGGMSGTSNSSGAVQGRVPMPQRSPEDAIRQMARGGGGGITVGDIGEGLGGLGESLKNPMAPKKNGSSLELLSDPMGVDFRLYLIRILSTVRRNWIAVIPESARLGGRRGKVYIQFAIDRNGSVPKLVIAMPSGTEALDRAAVAGISASNPFPPLPDEFKGRQIRLQFTFLYNIPSR